MAKEYGFIGHGTTLYATGSDADAFYVHEITTIHPDGTDWETIAFCPDKADAERISAALKLLNESEQYQG